MGALAHTEGTFLPSESQQLAEVVDFAHERMRRRVESAEEPPRLCAPDGTSVELTPTLVDALHAIAGLLASGQAVTVTSVSDELSTSEAADLLGVSRPTVVRWLEEGRLPYTQPGRHRRLRLVDVLRYQDERRADQREVLGRMIADDLTDGPYEA